MKIVHDLTFECGILTSFCFTCSCCFVEPVEIGGALFGLAGCEAELSKFGIGSFRGTGPGGKGGAGPCV